MSAYVRDDSPFPGQRARYRWECRDHPPRLRFGWWSTREHAQTQQVVHNAREHPDGYVRVKYGDETARVRRGSIAEAMATYATAHTSDDRPLT
jgi:hypothetical protein